MRWEECLWEKLAAERRPVFLYGTGDGADKILAACARYGISPTGTFASDGFVRNRTFHDMPVRSYAETTAEYGDDIVILLAFGTTLPAVRSFIEELDRKHTLYIPDVPLYGGALFDGAYFATHRERMERVLALFSEEKSARLFQDAVNFRLSGKYCYLQNGSDPVEALREVFKGRKIRTILDGGAYRGDSASDFIAALSPERIFAVEADERTFGRLSEYAERETRCRVIPTLAALWDENTETVYRSAASRGSGSADVPSNVSSTDVASPADVGKKRRARKTTVVCRTADDILGEETVDLIKLDVEGAEARALDGAAGTIARDRPALAVSLYHRTDDLMELVERVHAIFPTRRLLLRRADCIPFWDLTLYCVEE